MMQPHGFVHLHVHSYYSFLDSTLSPGAIVHQALEHGAKSVALTDINNMTGALVFYNAARAAGIRPILGAEITQPLASERKLTRSREKFAHGPIPEDDSESGECESDVGRSASASPALCHGDCTKRAILLARNFEGYSEISHLVTRRMLDAEFNLFVAVARLSANVVVLSDSVEVLAHAAGFRQLGNCYALLTASRRRRKWNRAVYECAKRLELPLVAGCDVKLLTAEDAPLHDLLQAMRRLTTVSRLADEERIDPAQHFQSPRSVAEFFGLEKSDSQRGAMFEDLRSAVMNTQVIAQECDCELPLEGWKFPALADVQDPEKELRALLEAGLKKRYGDPPDEAAVKRMNSELEVVGRLGFTEYFLLVHRIVNHAHGRGFFTVGRGSGANSILSYLLEFTDVCPIRYNLYFERFLNPDRTVPPDVDIDFSWRDRDELLQWCFDTFGQDRVALICTIQTMQGRQTIREVGKAHGLSETEVNAFTRLQETGFRVAEGNRGKSHDLSKQEPWRTVLEQADRIVGFPRHLSIHCGGIIITPQPVPDFVPLTRSAKGFVITQMDMFSVENFGLLKIDLLSNRSLGVLKDTLEMAESNRAEQGTGDEQKGADSGVNSGQDMEVFQREAMRMKAPGTRRGTSVALAGVLNAFATGPDLVPASRELPAGLREQLLDFSCVTGDPATRRVIDQGLTMGCFYIESPGMRALFERLRCKSFEEVVAASSIIRPGVAESGMMQEYINRHMECSAGSAGVPPARKCAAGGISKDEF